MRCGQIPAVGVGAARDLEHVADDAHIPPIARCHPVLQLHGANPLPQARALGDVGLRELIGRFGVEALQTLQQRRRLLGKLARLLGGIELNGAHGLLDRAGEAGRSPAQHRNRNKFEQAFHCTRSHRPSRI